jgi:hypothetical protein
MGRVYARVILAAVVAVIVSVGLYVYFVQSPYIFALGLALGCYIAQLTTFKDGVLFGSATSFIPALVMAAVGLAPADSNEAAVLLSAILIVIFGALYCGTITWLIRSLKHGKVIYS